MASTNSPNVGVLLQRLADSQSETPKGDVIRDIGGADSTETNICNQQSKW